MGWSVGERKGEGCRLPYEMVGSSLKPLRYSEISQWCGLVRVFHSLCWALNGSFPLGDHILQFWGILFDTFFFPRTFFLDSLFFERWTLVDWFSNFLIFSPIFHPSLLFYFLEYFLKFISNALISVFKVIFLFRTVLDFTGLLQVVQRVPIYPITSLIL